MIGLIGCDTIIIVSLHNIAWDMQPFHVVCFSPMLIGYIIIFTHAITERCEKDVHAHIDPIASHNSVESIVRLQ